MHAFVPFELFTVLTAVLGVGALLRPSDLFRWYYAPFAGVLLVLNLYERGLHWQIFPALTVLTACAVLLPLRINVARWAANLAILFAATSLPLLYILPEFTLPTPTGPYPIGTRTEHWLDPATQRELTVTLWYPAVPTNEPKARYIAFAEAKPLFVYEHWIRTNAFADAPALQQAFPVLLFGHMWGGRRTQDTFLAEDLASHGYIVAAPDHPGNSARSQRADGSVRRGESIGALSHLEQSGFQAIRQTWAAELQVWTADNQFVLAHLATLPWLHADLARIGAFGHSFGGAASIALLGAPGSGPPVQAASNLDGWTFNAIDHRTAQPILLVYATHDAATAGIEPVNNAVDAQLERSDRAALDRSLAQYGGTRLYVAGTQHADFTDQTLVSPIQRLTYTGPLPGPRARAINRGLVLSFFDEVLKHQGTLAAYPEVKSIP